ncbi:putative serine protease EDA2 isoform X2 [Wolffia australiana]
MANPSLMLLLIALCFLLGSFPGAECRRFHLPADESRYLTTEERWFNQTLDHFAPSDHRHFRQRYFEYLGYVEDPQAPIFLIIGGEGTSRGISNNYIAVLAKKFGAAIVSLEHRYYGKSSPFELHTTENLRYLSSKQALSDLAVFHHYYQELVNTRYNRSGVENPWFVFGGSYSGALSAWFRLKFPHLTCGSLASSAVVQAVYNFIDFDKQIGESAGPECKAVLQEITALVDEQLLSNRENVKNMFGASEIQYGNPDRLCAPLIEAKNRGNNLIEAYAAYVKDYYLGSFQESLQTYDQEYLKNVSVGEDSASRLWWFQVCSEVAYFQVAPPDDSVRSQKIDLKYHLDLCKNVFGDGVYPEVEMTNLFYGGSKIAGSRIIFTNGSQDPWRHASKQKSSKDMPSYIIKCHNCGHCSDFSGCPQSHFNMKGSSENCTSPEALDNVRAKIIGHIDLWLSECQKTDDNQSGFVDM